MTSAKGRSVITAASTAALVFGLGLAGDSLGGVANHVPETKPDALPTSVLADRSVLGGSAGAIVLDQVADVSARFHAS